MRGLAAIVVLGLCAGVALAEVDPAKIEAARKAVLDADYQEHHPRYGTYTAGPDGRPLDGRPTEQLPDDGEVTGSGSGKRIKYERDANGNLKDRRARRDLQDTRYREREQESPFAQFIMWGVLIALAIVLAIGIASELRDRDADPELPEVDDAQAKRRAEVEAILERPLGDADELAKRGEFAEAIHTLLLRTLQELVRSAAVRVAPAMTSREILARVPMLSDARDAFAGLITAVELTHFGDEPANADDYQRCREQFNVFAAALRAGASRPGTGTALGGTARQGAAR